MRTAECLGRVVKLLALCAIAVVFATPHAHAEQKDWQAQAKSDPVLQAMLEELDRSKSGLKLDQVAAPYYIEYRVLDVDEASVQAAFGALNLNTRTHFRFLRVVVRIGDYKQDSFFGQGEGTAGFLPVEDDNLSLRQNLWLTTDRAYKAAAQALTAKQAQLKQMTIDQPVDDFARAEPVHSIAPLARLDGKLSSSWNTALERASGLYVDDPQLEQFNASLHFSAVNRYFVNTEGTVVRGGDSFYETATSCSTQASDGTRLERSHGFVERNVLDLPSPQQFVKRASELAVSLRQLREAPVVEEEYRGPVLFSADAGSSIFADLIGENVLGSKPALGKTGRTTGAFSTSYKSRVLPEFVSVVDDPTISAYSGHALVGNYAFDDEGVPAQRVPVIDKGVLVNYVVGRTPIRDFPSSNGHGRARSPSNSPGPSLGNLIATSSETLSPADLLAKFLDMCKQRGLPYCYRVETFGPKLTPRLIYKVWVNDGHEDLMRGATFGDLDARALRSDLVATGSDFYVDSRLLNIPQSIVAPSLLFDELEMKRVSINKEKLPEYPAPPVSR